MKGVKKMDGRVDKGSLSLLCSLSHHRNRLIRGSVVPQSGVRVLPDRSRSQNSSFYPNPSQQTIHQGGRR